MQIVLLTGTAKTKNEDTHNTRVYCYCPRTREEKILVAQV